MSRGTFYKLLSVLLPDHLRDEPQSQRSSSGAVAPSVRLSLALRLLAGLSYIVVMMLFGINTSAVYAVFHSTLDAIMNRLSIRGVRFGS